MKGAETQIQGSEAVSANGVIPTADRLVDPEHAVEVFKALGHPVRLEIMRRMVNVEELSCTELENTLPIAKTTISYHIKLLYKAGLINVRKAGRFYFYTSRDEAIEDFAEGLLPLLKHRVG